MTKREDIQDHEARIEGLEYHIGDARRELAHHEQRLHGVGQTLAGNQERLGSLEERVDRLEDIMGLLGSIHPTPPTVHTWVKAKPDFVITLGTNDLKASTCSNSSTPGWLAAAMKRDPEFRASVLEEQNKQLSRQAEEQKVALEALQVRTFAAEAEVGNLKDKLEGAQRVNRGFSEHIVKLEDEKKALEGQLNRAEKLAAAERDLADGRLKALQEAFERNTKFAGAICQAQAILKAAGSPHFYAINLNTIRDLEEVLNRATRS